MKRILLASVLLVAGSALVVVLYHRVSSSIPGRAYAYHVPLNPYHPSNGKWGTLVRRSPVAIGDRIDVAVAHVSAVSGVSVSRARHKWKVVTIRSTADDGRSAAVRGWAGPSPIWSGTVVVRPVG
jgi:hypothetical protein